MCSMVQTPQELLGKFQARRIATVGARAILAPKRKWPRGEMEDEALVIPELRCGFTYAAIFDGHAGRECARYLRGNLHEQLAREVDLHSLRPARGAAEEAPPVDFRGF